jgi:hypothetical protein
MEAMGLVHLLPSMIPPYLISRFVTVIFVRFLPLESPVRMSLPPASITMLLKEYDLAANLHSVSRYISKSVALLHVAFKRGLISVVSSA